MKEGDRLPSERELGERFGVRRGAVREALKVLEAKRLATIKVGARGGVFVTAPTSERAGEGISDLLPLSVVDPSDLTPLPAWIRRRPTPQARQLSNSGWGELG